MNIIHICKADTKGGAIKAAYRIHRYLIHYSIKSIFYVDNKYSTDATVKTRFNCKIISQRYAKYRLMLEQRLFNKALKKKNHSLFTINYFPGMKINKKDLNSADIIHLHWIGNGTISAERIKSLKKTIVWRLSDMYAFTGGCHYSLGCEKYIDNCGSCPQLGSSKDNDLSRLILNRKKKAFKNLNMTIVTPSIWLKKCAEKSSLFKNKRVIHIATGVELNNFYPENQLIARKKILHQNYFDHKIILFGAYSLKDKRKGFKYLIEALKVIKNNSVVDKLILLTFGKENTINLDYPAFSLGFIEDFNLLRLIYSCADVYVVPSIEENLPNTGLEAMACGVPVVGFRVGGIIDMIDHKKNGYLAKPFDIHDLGNGILWTLRNNSKNELSTNALHKVSQEFEINKQTKKYIDLYQELIDQ